MTGLQGVKKTLTPYTADLRLTSPSVRVETSFLSAVQFGRRPACRIQARGPFRLPQGGMIGQVEVHQRQQWSRSNQNARLRIAVAGAGNSAVLLGSRIRVPHKCAFLLFLKELERPTDYEMLSPQQLIDLPGGVDPILCDNPPPLLLRIRRPRRYFVRIGGVGGRESAGSTAGHQLQARGTTTHRLSPPPIHLRLGGHLGRAVEKCGGRRPKVRHRDPGIARHAAGVNSPLNYPGHPAATRRR